MYFNRACIDKMNGAHYIELLFEPREKLLAIRSSKSSHQFAIKWVIDKDDKLTPSTNTSSGISEILFDTMEWDNSQKYRMFGVKRQKNDDIVVLFDPNNAEALKREEYQIIDTNEIKHKTISLYDDYYMNHFGNDFYQDIYSMRLYLMDVFKKWNLDANLISVEGDTEWITIAKQTVDKHLAKLMEVENEQG
jgi:hypothetical protein